MTQLLTLTSFLLLIVIVLAPLGYILVERPDQSFWADVMSGSLATAVALIAGIPLALWIDRHIKVKESKRDDAVARKKELELLELIREELQFSQNGVIQRMAAPGNFEIQPLKTDLWAAISSAGKLNEIQDHRLLNRIASAYYVLDFVREFERRGYIALRGPTVTFSNGETALQQIWADARRFDVLLRDSIAEAIGDIDADSARTA